MEILKLFKQFKLGNSVFKGHYRLSIDSMMRSKIPQNELESMGTKKMVEHLSNYILSKHPSSITREENEREVNFQCELLVLKVEDFKTIVEAAIQMIPDEQIRKIKAGN